MKEEEILRVFCNEHLEEISRLKPPSLCGKRYQDKAGRVVTVISCGIFIEKKLQAWKAKRMGHEFSEYELTRPLQIVVVFKHNQSLFMVESPQRWELSAFKEEFMRVSILRRRYPRSSWSVPL